MTSGLCISLFMQCEEGRARGVGMPADRCPLEAVPHVDAFERGLDGGSTGRDGLSCLPLLLQLHGPHSDENSLFYKMEYVKLAESIRRVAL